MIMIIILTTAIITTNIYRDLEGARTCNIIPFHGIIYILWVCRGNWGVKPKPKGKITWLVNVKLGPKLLTMTSNLMLLTQLSKLP